MKIWGSRLQRNKILLAKSYFAAIIIIFISTISISAKQPIMPVINLSFWTTPFISDFEDHGIIDLNGEVGGGFWISKYSVLFNTAIMYESAAEHNNKRHNRCQWTMRENFLFRIEIAKYFALSAQTGLGWQRMSVQSGINNIINSDYFVLGNRVLAEFLLPTKYLNLQLFSDADCYFGNNFRLRIDTFFRINAIALGYYVFWQFPPYIAYIHLCMRL